MRIEDEIKTKEFQRSLGKGNCQYCFLQEIGSQIKPRRF